MSYLLTPPDFPIITRMNPFKYHTVELRRLWDVTLAGLELNGISAEGLGEKHMDKFVLRGGLNLSQYSLSLLPPHLGGFSTEAPVDMSDRTATFIDAINTASPAGFKGSISNPRIKDGTGFTSLLDAKDTAPEEDTRFEEASAESAEAPDTKADKSETKAEKSEKPDKASDKSDPKLKQKEKSARPTSTRSTTALAALSSALASVPPTTPLRMSGRTAPAPASIRAHIDLARANPSQVLGPPAAGPLDPKADQVHVNANASNIRLVSEARQIIAKSNARFP